jgi:uncharacterized repeat protein (TIGR02543 family)
MTLYARWVRDSNPGNKVTFDANGGELPAATATYTATGVNTYRSSGGLIVYDESGATVDTDEEGSEAIINAAGKIVGFRQVGDTDTVSVPEGGLVISGQDGWDEDETYSGILAIEQMELGKYVGVNYETMEVSLYDTYAAYLTGEKYVAVDSAYGNLPTPTRAGYTFLGWFTSAEGGEQVTASTVMTDEGDVTLYAQWEVAYRVIDLEHNDGTGQFTRMTFVSGLPYGQLPVLTQTGYAFDGWWTKEVGGQQVTAESIVPSAGTLYAHWHQVSSYEICYDANGGTGAPAAQEKALDADLVLASDVPVRAGYTFLGWGIDPADTTPSYQPGEVYGQSASLTLYAVWTANTYTVAFQGNGGYCGTASKTVTYGSTYGQLPTPTRSGYTFLGWYTLPRGGTKITASAAVDSAVPGYLYAAWEEDQADEPAPDQVQARFEPFYPAEKDLPVVGLIIPPLTAAANG